MSACGKAQARGKVISLRKLLNWPSIFLGVESHVVMRTFPRYSHLTAYCEVTAVEEPAEQVQGSLAW